MKKIIALVMLLSFTTAFSQSIVGTWKTIDDETGKAKSYVKLFTKKDGKLYGKVVKILDPAKVTKKCTKCKGAKKNKSILGLEMVMGLEKDGAKAYEDGEILDPAKGKVYSCDMELVKKNKLKVRGYLGFSLIGRTQYWYRVK